MKFSDLDLNKSYSYEDYSNWDFEERVEIINGSVSILPTPVTNHQIVSGNLLFLFKNYLRGKNCRVYSAPFDVRLANLAAQRKNDKDISTVVQPDICVVCDISKIDRRGFIGSPDLIVEILSKGTAEKDIKDKFEVYEESGVLEYWIVSVEDCVATVFRLDKNGRYQGDHRPYVMGDTIRVGIFNDFEIPVDEIFEGLLDFKN